MSNSFARPLTRSLVGEACPLHCRTRSSAGILSFFSKRILRAHVSPGPFRGRDGISPKAGEAALDPHWIGFAKHSQIKRFALGQVLVRTNARSGMIRPSLTYLT
jgi:hypothetical protein